MAVGSVTFFVIKRGGRHGADHAILGAGQPFEMDAVFFGQAARIALCDHPPFAQETEALQGGGEGLLCGDAQAGIRPLCAVF